MKQLRKYGNHYGAGCCLALGCIFHWLLPGYQTIALFCFAGAALCLVNELVKEKRLRTVLGGCLALSLLLLLIAEIPIVQASRTTQSPEMPYIIVLGAGVNGTTPSLSLRNRLEAALDYLQRYPDSIAILSGGQGQGEEITEAEAMARWLHSNGIAEDRLIKEDQATNTVENLTFSLACIQQREGERGLPDRIGLVTSEYHLYRAKQIAAQQAELEMVGIPATTSLPILKLNYFLREGAAVWRLWLLGY